MTKQELKTHQWLIDGQAKALEYKSRLETLVLPQDNQEKPEIVPDQSIKTFLEPYKAALEPFVEELHSAGFKVEDLGLRPKNNRQLQDRNLLLAINQHYPEAQISFNPNAFAITAEKPIGQENTQTWLVTSIDSEELALLQATPIEHEVYGFVGIKIKLQYAGLLAAVKGVKSLSPAVFEVVNPHDIIKHTEAMQNNFAEILVFSEKMKFLQAAENLTQAAANLRQLENEVQRDNYHHKLQTLILGEIATTPGITPLEIRRRLLVHEADYDALRNELYSLRENSTITYIDGKFYIK